MVQHDNKPRRFAAYICMALSIAAALLSAVLCARLPFTAPADAEEVSVSPAAEPELPPLPAPEGIPAPAPESAGPADGVSSFFPAGRVCGRSRKALRWQRDQWYTIA